MRQGCTCAVLNTRHPLTKLLLDPCRGPHVEVGKRFRRLFQATVRCGEADVILAVLFNLVQLNFQLPHAPCMRVHLQRTVHPSLWCSVAVVWQCKNRDYVGHVASIVMEIVCCISSCGNTQNRKVGGIANASVSLA